jgi:hypothetical protein
MAWTRQLQTEAEGGVQFSSWGSAYRSLVNHSLQHPTIQMHLTSGAQKISDKDHTQSGGVARHVYSVAPVVTSVTRYRGILPFDQQPLIQKPDPWNSNATAIK